jgi:biopolymer transport protein ExbD
MPIKIHHDPEPTLNLTPMIDIVFLLIIFFMVGTKFAELERQIKLEIPAVRQFGAMTPAPAKRVVNVYRDNTIMMDQRTLTIDQLIVELKRARQEYSELAVLIRGDAEGPFHNVVNVLAACRDAGFDKMGIAVRAQTQRR